MLEKIDVKQKSSCLNLVWENIIIFLQEKCFFFVFELSRKTFLTKQSQQWQLYPQEQPVNWDVIEIYAAGSI